MCKHEPCDHHRWHLVGHPANWAVDHDAGVLVEVKICRKCGCLYVPGAGADAPRRDADKSDPQREG